MSESLAPVSSPLDEQRLLHEQQVLDAAGEAAAAGYLPEGPEAQAVDPNDPSTWDDDMLKQKFQTAAVDITSGVHANSDDAADAYINSKTNSNAEGNFFTRLKDKVWTGNIARDAIRVSQKAKAREEILESENMFAAQGLDKEAHDAAAAAVVGRFFDDTRVAYSTLNKGEQELQSTPESQAMDGDLRDLIKKFATGGCDEEQLQEEKKQIMSRFGQSVSQGDLKKGLLFADNVIEVAKNAKAAVDHQVGMDRIDAALRDVKLLHGEARVGVRTQAELSKVEQLAEWMSSKKWLPGNEVKMAVLASVAVTASGMAVKGAIKAATLGLATGAVAGVWAGVRESGRVKRDRASQGRDQAEGGTVDARMENKLYDKKPAFELTAEVNAAADAIGSDPDSMRRALAALAEARTRINKSDEENIDLISYSSKADVEFQRWGLNYAVADAKAKLYNTIADADEATRAALGIGADHPGLETLIDEYSAEIVSTIETDMAQRDKLFETMRAKSVAKMAGIAFVLGETAAIGIQESAALAEDYVGGDNRQSVFEGRGDDHSQATVLGSLRNWLAGDSGAVGRVEALGAGIPMPEQIADQLKMSVPQSFSISQDPASGELTFIGTDGKQIGESFAFDPNADPATVLEQSLHNAGYETQIGSRVVGEDNLPFQEGVTFTPQEYIAQHQESFSHVTREMWYDNNTEVPDFKELGLQLREDGDGNIVVKMAGFDEADGSAHGDQAAQIAQLQRDGKFQLAMSMSKDTQNFARMVEFNANGEAVIPKGSFESQMFDVRDGEVVITGGDIEASEIRGLAEDGRLIIRPVATALGEGTLTYVTPPHHNLFTVDVTAQAANVSTLDTGVPVAVPLVARRGVDRRPADPLGTFIDPVDPEPPVGLASAPTPGGEPEPVRPPEVQNLAEPNGREDLGSNGPVVDGELVPIDGELAPAVGSDPLEPGNGLPILDAEVIPGSELEPFDPLRNARQIGPADSSPAFPDGEDVAASYRRRPQYVIQNELEQGGPGVEVAVPDRSPIIGGLQDPPRARAYAEIDQAALEARRALENSRPQIGGDRLELEPLRRELEAAPSEVAALAVISGSPRDFSDPASFLNTPQAVGGSDSTDVEAEGASVSAARSVSDERNAIISYLDKERNRDPETYGEVEATVENLPPMSSENRMSLNVLTSQGMNDNDLRRQLAGYVDQRNASGERLAEGTYEINVAVPLSYGGAVNNATVVVDEFVHDFEQQNGYRPPVNIVGIETVGVSPESTGSTEANIRKIMADATLRRSVERTGQSAPLYIESQEVDDSQIDRQTVAKSIEKLDSNPEISALEAVRDKTPDYIANNDLLLLQQRARQFYSVLTRANPGQNKSSSRNTESLLWNKGLITDGLNATFSAEAYARGEGYDPAIEIAMHRAKEIGTLEAGNKAYFNNVLNRFAQESRANADSEVEADAVTKRLFFWLGLKNDDYTMKDGQVVVRDWSNVRKSIDRFMERRERRERRQA